jgi:hypothetical protein
MRPDAISQIGKELDGAKTSASTEYRVEISPEKEIFKISSSFLSIAR